MLSLAADIFLNILGPILLLVLMGALLRWKFRLDVATLSKLNIYLFVPAFVYWHVSTSALDWADMAGIFSITVLQVVTLGLLLWGAGRALRVPARTLSAVALAVMFYNSGNYGIPLAQLAYPSSKLLAHGVNAKDGAAVQAFVVMAQNLLTFTVGMAIASSAGGGGIRQGLRTLIRMPVLPTLAAAILSRWYLRADPHHTLPAAIAQTARYLADGLVPVALVTLGAQLAVRPRWPRWRPVSLVLALRLLFGPVQMAGLLWVLHHTGARSVDLWPWPAELLILTAAVPTAVNTLLLTLEVGGDAELAADCVFWTTIVSCVTITGWLIVMRRCFG